MKTIVQEHSDSGEVENRAPASGDAGRRKDEVCLRRLYESDERAVFYG